MVREKRVERSQIEETFAFFPFRCYFYSDLEVCLILLKGSNYSNINYNGIPQSFNKFGVTCVSHLLKGFGYFLLFLF